MVVLIISPHTDDAELGMGATISKLVREKNKVYHLVVCPNIIPESTSEEFIASNKVLGVTDTYLFQGFEHRTLHEKRQELLDRLIPIRDILKPDRVYIPALDIHQDHEAVHKEALRCFKDVDIYCYNLVWNLLSTENKVFSLVTEEDIDKKVQALKQYKSQKYRPYFQEDLIRGQIVSNSLYTKGRFCEILQILKKYE